MKSFQKIYERLQDITGDDDTTTRLPLFKEDINATQDLVLSAWKWPFLSVTENITTAADTASYEIPESIRKIRHVQHQVDSDTYYNPEPVHNIDFWESLQALRRGSSDVTEFWMQDGRDLLVWPAISTASATLQVRGRKNVIEMTLDDYTTGTIDTATNGSTAIVGTGTPNWSSRTPLGNQWIKITRNESGGDGRWYKVASIDSDTGITLEKDYEGTTFTGQTQAYTLSEFPDFPGEYHDLCIFRPLALYYEQLEYTNRARSYWRRYDGGFEAGFSTQIGGLMKKMIDEQLGSTDSMYLSPAPKVPRITPEIESLENINEGGTW